MRSGLAAWQKSILVTAPAGPPDGRPILFLHDRYGDYPDGLALSDGFGGNVLRIAVRSARTHVAGTDIKGYYWFLGPLDRPELTTLGDALYHLEALLLELETRADGKRIGLVGVGEGGVMALLIAVIWPDLISCVAAVDAGLPDNLKALPVEKRPLNGMQVLLARTPDAFQESTATGETLLGLGGRVAVVEVHSRTSVGSILARRWPA